MKYRSYIFLPRDVRLGDAIYSPSIKLAAEHYASLSRLLSIDFILRLALSRCVLQRAEYNRAADQRSSISSHVSGL
jgi:hypothetical protein